MTNWLSAQPVVNAATSSQLESRVAKPVRRKTLMMPRVAVMSPAMAVARRRLSIVVCARPAPDNYHVSESIGVSVAAVIIVMDRAGVPMMIESCDVIVISVTTVRGRSPTSQNKCSDCQGGRY